MRKKIIIIGAGISGLYLASMLEEKYEVTILEARDRVGGRVCSENGHDLGPSWIWPHHTQMLGLIEALGLEMFMQYTDGYALYDTKDKVEVFRAPPSSQSMRVKGSLSKVIEGLKNRLKKTKVKLNHKVHAISKKDSQICVEVGNTAYDCDYTLVTLPPRLATQIYFSPNLSQELIRKMSSTQTWMGNSAKCVIEFQSTFWRDKGLSGFTFSPLGPLSEIHDASTENKAALFGFVSASVNMESFEELLKEQLRRVFDINDSEILKVYLVDWKREKFTSTSEDAKPLKEHPQYGIDTGVWNEKILFSATEFSTTEGGYLEGAIIRASEVLKELV